MSSRLKSKICITLIFIVISTLLSTPMSIKANVDYIYDGSGCQDEDHPYCVFINTIVIPSGFQYRISKGGKLYKANMDIYNKDKEAHKAFKIVYGDHDDIENNEKDDKGEWRYLGFDMNKNVVSNEDFTNDREIGEDEKFTDWIFTVVTGAKNSWDNARDKFKNEIIQYNWTAKWLKEGKMTELSADYEYKNNDDNSDDNKKGLNDESKVLLLSPATFLTEGSVRVEHDVNGSIYYSTFTIPAMAKLAGEILSENGTIGVAEDSVDIDLGSKAYFKDNDYLKANKDLISELRVHVNEYKIDTSATYIKIKKEDKEKYGGSRTEDIEVEKNDDFITFKREDFTETTTNNEHLVEFKGTAYFRSDLTGEEREVELTKTIKITIEDRDLSAKSINVKHFEKNMDTGNTRLIDQSSMAFNEDKTERVSAKSGRSLIETREGPEVNSMTSSRNSSVQVSVDKFTAGDT